MGLICWLPLMGTLENKGVSNITVTNNGATVDTSGKIGSCYSFNGNNYYISLVGQQLFDCFKGGNQQFSMCMWVYHADSRRAVLFGDWSLSNSIGFNIELNTGHGVRFYWNGSPDYFPGINVGASIWSHITFTYDGTALRSYLNGNLIATRSGALAARSKTGGEFRLGRDNRTTETALNGKINDVRIYKDHCLSAAEVKEISQGLVLHYKLDDPNPNLITDNIYLAAPWATAVKAHEEYQGRLAYRVANNTLYSNTSSGTNTLFPNITFIANIQYTLSVTWRDDYRTDGKNSSLYLRFIYSDGSTATQMISPANSIHEWQHQSITSTAGKTVSKITTTYGNGGQLYITDLKLEVGTVDTGFAGNNHIIQDSSGYNHNGTINGNIIISSDTNRYDCSTQFDGVDDSIIVPYNTICPENIFTFNLWFKKDALGSKNYETLFGGPSGFEMDTRAGSATTLSLYMASTRSTKRNLVTELSLGNWYMITMTRDGTKEKYYVNGIFQSEIDAKSMPNGIYRIGAWASNTGQNYYGLISDFRIYCTALSADDILQLYHTSAKIDNKKNLHTYELIENSPSIKINKRGQTLCNELQEGTAMKFYKTDSIIETNVLNEF